SMIGPSAAGVVGVCNMDIQVRAFALPPAESPPPPQAARAVAPRAAAGRDFRRDRRGNMTGFLSGAARSRSESGLVAVASLRRRAVRHRTGRGQVLWVRGGGSSQEDRMVMGSRAPEGGRGRAPGRRGR